MGWSCYAPQRAIPVPTSCPGGAAHLQGNPQGVSGSFSSLIQIYLHSNLSGISPLVEPCARETGTDDVAS